MQEEYEIDYANNVLRKKGTDFVIQRETPEAFALPKSKAKAKTKVLRYPVAAAPCAGGCTIFSWQGSNAHTSAKLVQCAEMSHRPEGTREEISARDMPARKHDL